MNCIGIQSIEGGADIAKEIVAYTIAGPLDSSLNIILFLHSDQTLHGSINIYTHTHIEKWNPKNTVLPLYCFKSNHNRLATGRVSN